MALTKSLQSPGRVLVRCIDGQPIPLTRIGTPQSQHAEERHSFLHFDCHLGCGWSSVYASSRSQTVIKFATVPKKDSAELQRHIRNERVAYDQLYLLTGWAIPRCYGLYSWYGGLSLILSYGGPSLPKSKIEKFISLGLTERCDSLPFRRECF